MANANANSLPGKILVMDRSSPGRWSRREVAFFTAMAPQVALALAPLPAAQAEETNAKKEEGSLLDGILSVFDPNEMTKSGKKLPKSYLKAARDVVKNLREALQKDRTKEEQKFREAANTAKDSIREYLTNWKNSKEVQEQSSFQDLEKALRRLGNFYLKSGPTAAMPDDVKSEILQNLTNAEADL